MKRKHDTYVMEVKLILNDEQQYTKDMYISLHGVVQGTKAFAAYMEQELERKFKLKSNSK